MIRCFMFKNSFLTEDTEMVSAEYSSVGYFDALDIIKAPDEEGKSVLSAPMQVKIVDGFYETCDYFNIAGMRWKDDEDFWREEKKPFLFISCVRLKKSSDKLQEISGKIEEKYTASCYFTFDSSDLVICMRSNSYIQGYNDIEQGYPEIIMSCDKENGVQKCYSILSVRQEILDNLPNDSDGMAEETVSCLLSGIVKRWSEVDAFIAELERESGASNCIRYGILGSDDVIISVQNVKIIDLFNLYGKNKLLTHGNDLYKRAFYKIKTEILVKAGKRNE